MRAKFPSPTKTLNHLYFDNGAYRTNPHFRFEPAWFKGTQNPSILCIGDSLTDLRFPTVAECDPNVASVPPPAYSEVLRGYLAEVGIAADITNVGFVGAFIWNKSPNSPFNWTNSTYPPAGRAPIPLSSSHTLAIIWIGTNDLAYINNRQVPGTEGLMTEAAIRADLKWDFVALMRKYKAAHYLLVKVDGARGPDCPNTGGRIDLEKCPRFITGPYLSGPGVVKQVSPAETVNETLLELEQAYLNVHVAEIDYGIERCPSVEKNLSGNFGGYIHFNRKEGIAKSIFGRIMCHAIFHRESGDLRWVGAEPNTKKRAGIPTMGS